jgi:glycosyltransferase involved in cell wall biosynthesis
MLEGMKEKHRLMLITHDLSIGGLQQVVVNICKTINRDLFDVSVLCLRSLGEYAPVIERMEIEVILLPQKSNGTDYFSPFKVAKILRQKKIEIIHTHNTQPFVDGTIGALLSGVRTIVHTDHSREFPDKRRYMFAEWLMSHFAYQVVGVSDPTSQALTRYEKISPGKVITILNGIDGSRFEVVIDKEKKKKELGITNDGPIIGFGVRLTKAKGITYLLQAMPEIMRAYPNITLVIAGTGDYEDRLKKEARDRGIDKNVLFLGPRLDIPELLKLFDLYVLPSLWEGLPIALLEAMAAGCPVVATKVGGNYMVIQHGENGSLIEPQNPSLLASEIISVLTNEELRKNYAAKSASLFKERFTARVMTGQYERLYLREKAGQAKVKKIRLMQITHDLAIGGLQQVVVNICKSIDRNMFDISVLCLRNLGEFVPEIEKMGIKVHFLPQKRNGVDYLSFLKVAKILRDQRVDVIHTHNTQPFIDGTIAAFLSGVKTIIHTDHSREFPDKRRYMFSEWLMSHFAYKVVGVSEPTRQDLIKYEKISPEKVVTIINGIDESKFLIEIDKERKKKELGITNDGPIIGLGVRLSKQKGITYLLQAMPEIIKAYPDITLVIAGGGDYEERLKQETRDRGITKNVLFIGPRLDMPEVLKLFDLYVLPSLWEGLPIVILEAMAAGCPIVATNVGGNYMAIQHGENGVLIEPKKPALLASEIIRVLRNEDLRTNYAKKGMELFKSKFSAEVMTQHYQRLYLS